MDGEHILGYFWVLDGRVLAADPVLRSTLIRSPTTLPIRNAVNRLKAKGWTARKVESHER